MFEYHDGNTVLHGYVSKPKVAANTSPVVMVCPDWTGRNTFADQEANALAELGYTGFAIDVYGEGRQGKDNDEKSKLIQPFMTDRNKLQKRLLAAFEAAQTLSPTNNIAVLGFCFGGLCALDLARAGAALRGAISFHGLLRAPESPTTTKIQAKILVLHGYDDPMVPPDEVISFANEMTKAKVDWQIHMYGNTLHAFTNPLANDPGFGTVYNETAKVRSMLAMKNFLAEIFKI